MSLKADVGKRPLIPILYVGSAGGEGSYHYTATLTASRDVQSVFVQMLPDEERLYDFGHADLFAASDAESLVWRPILDWLVEHRSDRTYPGPWSRTRLGQVRSHRN